MEDIFSTRDLYLASTLITLRFRLTGYDVQYEGIKSTPVGYFKFENSPEIQEAKSKYVQGLLSIEPKTFVLNMRSLKAEIMNYIRTPHQFQFQHTS